MKPVAKPYLITDIEEASNKVQCVVFGGLMIPSHNVAVFLTANRNYPDMQGAIDFAKAEMPEARAIMFVPDWVRPTAVRRLAPNECKECTSYHRVPTDPSYTKFTQKWLPSRPMELTSLTAAALDWIRADWHGRNGFLRELQNSSAPKQQA
jgi:hypothetical protein